MSPFKYVTNKPEFLRMIFAIFFAEPFVTRFLNLVTLISNPIHYSSLIADDIMVLLYSRDSGLSKVVRFLLFLMSFGSFFSVFLFLLCRLKLSLLTFRFFLE